MYKMRDINVMITTKEDIFLITKNLFSRKI